MDDVGVDTHAVVLGQLNFDLPGLVRAACFALLIGHVADDRHIICGFNALRCVGHGTRVDRKRKGLFRGDRTRVGQLIVFLDDHAVHVRIRLAAGRKGGHDADAHGQRDGKHTCEKLFCLVLFHPEVPPILSCMVLAAQSPRRRMRVMTFALTALHCTGPKSRLSSACVRQSPRMKTLSSGTA